MHPIPYHLLKEATMLVELSIVPTAGEKSTSDVLAEVLSEIHRSGLPYQLTPSATCIEGNWDEVMSVVRRCHDLTARWSDSTVTLIKIQSDGELSSNVTKVETALGHAGARSRRTTVVEEAAEESFPASDPPSWNG